MYSTDVVLITPFLHNPYRSLLVCIDLASEIIHWSSECDNFTCHVNICRGNNYSICLHVYQLIQLRSIATSLFPSSVNKSIKWPCTFSQCQRVCSKYVSSFLGFFCTIWQVLMPINGEVSAADIKFLISLIEAIKEWNKCTSVVWNNVVRYNSITEVFLYYANDARRHVYDMILSQGKAPNVSVYLVWKYVPPNMKLTPH